MNRRLAASVLVLFVASLSYSTAAEAMGVHHVERAGCDDGSLHYCGDQVPHDADHCTFCHVGSIWFSLPCVEVPGDIVRSAAAAVAFVRPTSRAFTFAPFAPRAPPALAS